MPLPFCQSFWLGTDIDVSSTDVTCVTINCLLKRKNIMIKPLQDRVLVEPKEAETKTASGLYIPDSAKEKPLNGRVVAVGRGLKDEPMEVAVGDEVLYGKYAGTEISYEGKKYLIMKQSDILAIL